MFILRYWVKICLMKSLVDLGCVNWNNLTTEASRAKLMRAIEKSNWDNKKVKELLFKNINWDLL